jgi:hypothetical protein
MVTPFWPAPDFWADRHTDPNQIFPLGLELCEPFFQESLSYGFSDKGTKAIWSTHWPVPVVSKT